MDRPLRGRSGIIEEGTARSTERLALRVLALHTSRKSHRTFFSRLSVNPSRADEWDLTTDTSEPLPELCSSHPDILALASDKSSRFAYSPKPCFNKRSNDGIFGSHDRTCRSHV